MTRAGGGGVSIPAVVSSRRRMNPGPAPPVSHTWPGLTREREAVTSEVSDPARLTVSGHRSTGRRPWLHLSGSGGSDKRSQISCLGRQLQRHLSGVRGRSQRPTVGCPRSMIPASVSETSAEKREPAPTFISRAAVAGGSSLIPLRPPAGSDHLHLAGAHI